MGVIQRVVKPKTQRAKRALEKRAPKIVENSKQALFIRGATANNTSHQCMKDLYALKRTHSTLLNKKNDFNPYEDIMPVEQLTRKSDASLFAFCSHNKKRPSNLVLGRMFDFHLLDMIEMGVESFKPLSEFRNSKVAQGIKPCLLFAGEPWQTSDDYERLKNLLIDFFHGEEVENIRLNGLEHTLMFTAAEGKIYMRSYKVLLKKSGSKTPRIELEEIGPSIDFSLRRTRLASADLFKAACRKPVHAKPKKVKNISKDVFGSKMGRIHMPRQDYKQLQVKRGRALRPSKDERIEQKRQRKAQKQQNTTQSSE